MAISGSSALKINLKARITHLGGLTATVSLFILLRPYCLCMFGLLVERLAVRAVLLKYAGGEGGGPVEHAFFLPY